jgi:hypothetical protein
MANVYAIECPICHATPKSYCSSVGGKILYAPHGKRVQAAEEFKSRGWYVPDTVFCATCGGIFGARVMHRCRSDRSVVCTSDYGGLTVTESWSERQGLGRVHSKPTGGWD